MEYYTDGTAATGTVDISLECTVISSAKPAAMRGIARIRMSSSGARMTGGFLIDADERVFLASGRRARMVR